LLLIGAGNFLITGPLYVGLPVLANTRYAGGPADLGLILSLFGAGSLIGVTLAAIGPERDERFFFRTMGACALTLGAGLVALGLLPSAAPASLVAATMGLAQGYMVVRFVTLLQKRTPSALLGRVMSLLVFLVMGLAPLSSAFAGALIEISVSGLLIGAGVGLMSVVVLSFLLPSTRPFSETAEEGRH
jgi:putative flippase GtrA